jgi:hypothetical protein
VQQAFEQLHQHSKTKLAILGQDSTQEVAGQNRRCEDEVTKLQEKQALSGKSFGTSAKLVIRVELARNLQVVNHLQQGYSGVFKNLRVARTGYSKM